MRILPEANLKDVGKCEPGELVRPCWYGENVLGLVASFEQNRFLIVLNDDGQEPLPYYQPLQDGEFVLSYGQDYEIAVDHSASMELGARRLYEVPGNIIRSRSSWLLRVIGSRERGLRGNAYYDLGSSSVLFSLRDLEIVTFTKWSVRLPASNDKDEPVTLARFGYPSTQEDG